MTCDLISGTFGKAVQGILGLLTMATLALKWSQDKTGRTRQQFLMDSFKNCSGAASLHVTNLFFASMLAPALKGGDACQWYWTEIMIDTTLGVYIEFRILMTIIERLKKAGYHEIANDLSAHAVEAHDGAADTKPQALEAGGAMPLVVREKVRIDWFKYAKQVAAWLVVVQLMKLCMTMIIIFEAYQLNWIAGMLLNPLNESPAIKLMVVMVLTPFFMNMFQFWLQDNIFVSAARNAQREADLLKIEEESRHLEEELSRLQKDADEKAKQLEASKQAEQAATAAKTVAEQEKAAVKMQDERLARELEEAKRTAQLHAEAVARKTQEAQQSEAAHRSAQLQAQGAAKRSEEMAMKQREYEAQQLQHTQAINKAQEDLRKHEAYEKKLKAEIDAVSANKKQMEFKQSADDQKFERMNMEYRGQVQNLQAQLKAEKAKADSLEAQMAAMALQAFEEPGQSFIAGVAIPVFDGNPDIQQVQKEGRFWRRVWRSAPSRAPQQISMSGAR